MFQDEQSPIGSETDIFRFSVAGTSSGWPASEGNGLARMYWDFGRTKTQWLTNYYDASSPSGGIIRVHRFAEHVTESRTVTVAFELMRPDEPPDDTVGVASRMIYVNRLTPVACARAEAAGYLSTWKVADQYLSAGCSSLGPSIRYRWQPYAGAPWTAWTPDTLYDFPGHAQTGSRVVVLQTKDLTTQQTANDTLPFAVSSGQVVLNGPTYITDKTSKHYWASSGHSGQWFERYDDGTHWYPATAYDTTAMNRIWPMGEYTVDLRQHKVSGGVLHRGRLLIEICSSPGCGPAAPITTEATVVAQAGGDWGLFGVGPWIGWGGSATRNVMRLYDLWGMPDRVSPFGETAWLDGTGGRFADAETGWEVVWARRDLTLADVQAFEFSVAGVGARPYVFGFAVDPDLGPNPADDVASWDPVRGLLTVADGSRAVGFLLRNAAGNALRSVQEYGVGRFAPTTADYAWAAQRRPGVQLVGTPRDVQLVLSAGETSEAATWLLVAIRGASPQSVRTTADEVIRVTH